VPGRHETKWSKRRQRRQPQSPKNRKRISIFI